MEVLYPRCAGLDVHKDTVVGCVQCVSAPKAHEVRSFGTTTREILALSDWLESHGRTHVAMEATGVYWKPVWHLLEGQFELVREISQHSLRIQKVLEDANIKVASVLSDVLGHCGRAMLAALIEGQDDPERLADLARGTARKKRTELVEALRGHVTDHHRSLIELHLNLIAALESALEQIDASVGKALAPISRAVDLLKTMPGVSDTVAHVIVAEIGDDMTHLPPDLDRPLLVSIQH